MDYSKINLDEAELGMKTLSGNEFEMKSWKEMEEGEQFIKQMLLVGIKNVKTPNGPASILQFQHPTNKNLKRCVWTNTLLNNAIENGDLEEKSYYLYTLTYLGMKEKKGGGKPYHNLELGITDLRKFGFVALEDSQASSILKETHQAQVMVKTEAPSDDKEDKQESKKKNSSIEDIVDSLV